MLTARLTGRSDNKETQNETPKTIAAVLPPLPGATGLALAQNSNQGVSKTEITIGSIQDLSGPIAGFGKQVRLGMMLRVDEINEQGGINGRKIKLFGGRLGLRPQEGRAGRAEAGQPGQDLRDDRPHRHRAEPGHLPGAVREERHQLLPGHGRARNVRAVQPAEVLLRRHLLRPDALATPKLVKEKGAKKVCTMYQDDEFGLEVMRGAEDGLKDIGMTWPRRPATSAAPPTSRRRWPR
jgi:branched-chain amino acid transport system substrate-binding protein